jgi:ribosome-associated protein
MSNDGIRCAHKEGYEEALWILLDYSDVIVHIFCAETRSFYGLERLWGDAPQVAFKE